jgi:Arc/MetJ-type ribon-helix-helix transcriptional regulator
MFKIFKPKSCDKIKYKNESEALRTAEQKLKFSQQQYRKWYENARKNVMINNQYSSIYSATVQYDTITASAITADETIIIKGKLEVNHRDILKELDEMRDALLLLKRDVDMEAKYPRLRELKDQYEHALEVYKTYERLK